MTPSLASVEHSAEGCQSSRASLAAQSPSLVDASREGAGGQAHLGPEVEFSALETWEGP